MGTVPFSKVSETVEGHPAGSELREINFPPFDFLLLPPVGELSQKLGEGARNEVPTGQPSRAHGMVKSRDL